MQNIQNMQNMHSVGLCMVFEQEQQLAEPDVTRPELKCAVGYNDSWRAYKHHVLAIGQQFLRHKRPRRDAHVLLGPGCCVCPIKAGGTKEDKSALVLDC